MGDFYETFFEDAVLLSRELEITLTGRECGKLGRIPLAGVPVKSLDSYLEKLVQKDFKVAICEQLEDPKFAKGIVKRGVVRIITAGTLLETNFLNQNSNNYMCALFKESDDKWGFAYTDISTGEFKASTLKYETVLTELARIQPAEIIAQTKKLKLEPFQIVPEETVDLPDEITKFYNCSKVPSRVFENDFAQNNLKAVFKLNSLEALGYNSNPIAYRASAGLLAYIWENMKEGFPKFERIELYELSNYVSIDVHTRKNLELTETLREKNKYGSLLWAIDKTTTPMGARLLKSWVCQPLKDIKLIQKRQENVHKLFGNSSARNDIVNLLKSVCLSSDCWLRMIAVSYFVTIGELIFLSLTITHTFAVPPLISGPYEGIHVTSMSCMIAQYARIFPIERTPCPPKPAMIISSFMITLLLKRP